MGIATTVLFIIALLTGSVGCTIAGFSCVLGGAAYKGAKACYGLGQRGRHYLTKKSDRKKDAMREQFQLDQKNREKYYDKIKRYNASILNNKNDENDINRQRININNMEDRNRGKEKNRIERPALYGKMLKGIK